MPFRGSEFGLGVGVGAGVQSGGGAGVQNVQTPAPVGLIGVSPFWPMTVGVTNIKQDTTDTSSSRDDLVLFTVRVLWMQGGRECRENSVTESVAEGLMLRRSLYPRCH